MLVVVLLKISLLYLMAAELYRTMEKQPFTCTIIKILVIYYISHRNKE